MTVRHLAFSALVDRSWVFRQRRMNILRVSLVQGTVSFARKCCALHRVVVMALMYVSPTLTFTPRTTSSAPRNGGTQVTEISATERADAISSDSQGSVREIARGKSASHTFVPSDDLGLSASMFFTIETTARNITSITARLRANKPGNPRGPLTPLRSYSTTSIK